ncbi:hypothetical protein JCM8202v2_000458 [Rhodotorula sphaerocarpa]
MPKRPRLKSAQRFAVLLALADVVATSLLLGEAVTAFTLRRDLGASGGARSRIFLATTLRPTLLLTIAGLSYLNVVQGKAFGLGKADCFIWMPCVAVCALAAGLAAWPRASVAATWAGLSAWLSLEVALVVACFGRLLYAILRLGPRVGGEDHDVITLGRSAGADDDAASIASFASRASTRGPGALKLQQAWEGQNRPGSGHAPHVGLSEREARGALIRVGGHLVGAIISYALVAPFVFSRSLEGRSLRLPAADYGLICGIALPSAILAWQCAASQGIWFRSASSATARAASPAPTDMTTDHVVVDMEERLESQASTIRSYKDCVVGIETDGADVASTRRGSLGRAVSMLSSRPKLQILPQHARSTSVSSAVRGPTHARLRSLHLPKLTGRQSDQAHRSAAAARCASPTTLAEHEARSKMPTRATHQDELIALSLLKSRKAVPPPEQREPSHTASSTPSK